MAESEESRLKRLKHEEHMSRVFDEVMGLGEFADSSQGSAGSSKSSAQGDAKAGAEPSGPEEEEPSSSGRAEEKSNSEEEKRVTSSSPQHSSSFNISTSEGGGGGSGAAAFDDALDGLPSLGREEKEDWHFSLPVGALEDEDVTKFSKTKETGEERGEERSKERSKERGEETPAQDARDEEEEEEEEEEERQGSAGSTTTSNSSNNPTRENSLDGAAASQAEDTEDSQQGEAKEAPAEDSNPPVSPSVNIKEEPEDEGYDAALLPQSSIKQIKEELEQEEELRISSVFSVGGGTAFATPTTPAPAPAPVPVAAMAAAPIPVPTALFIPGRGTVLQAMTPLAVRAAAPTPLPLPALPLAVPRPAAPPMAGCVRCSGCTKILLKGQTAFQRKGSTQLFCSTVCLTGHLPPIVRNRVCFQCKREIAQPRDMVTIPTSDRSFMHFCGQFCLSVFQHKKKVPEKAPEASFERKLEKKPEKPPAKPVECLPAKPLCSVCRISNKIEHEVNHQGRLHNLCSDACFATWRMMRKLAMNCCEVCGLYCNSSSGASQTLLIDNSQLNFCSPTCLSTYKQTSTKAVACASCATTAVVSSTTMERDQKGKVQLYCSAACVGRSRPSRHVLTDAAFPCSLCKVSAVPQYHLAMADGTIRNFCSFSCVTIYRKTSHASQSELTNGSSSLREPPAAEAPPPTSSSSSSSPSHRNSVSSASHHQGSHPSHTTVPPLVPPLSQTTPPSQSQKEVGGASDGPKVTCHQCLKQFNTKPLLFSHRGRIFVFCQKACCEQYKVQRNITAVCENCKKDKVQHDTISYNHKDLVFCGDHCKSLFKQEQLSHKKDQSWSPCSYCGGVNLNTVPVYSHYGGRMEEFCRAHCMSQYTVLYYGMGRCDSCRTQGLLTEKLQCLGSVRNFCAMPCLLQYCYFHFETVSSNSTGAAPQTPRAKTNPVIAEVVSLADDSANQPCVSADTALTGQFTLGTSTSSQSALKHVPSSPSGTLPTSTTDGKNLDHASTQTDALRATAPLRRRQMKNKSVMCRPITVDQENMCQLPSTESGALVDSTSQCDQPPASPPAKPHADPAPNNHLPQRLSGRHFLGKRDTPSDCKVCSHHKRRRKEQEEAELPEDPEWKSGTAYYCKTCSGEPRLCPVPCFELYHTQLIYRTLLQLHANAAEPRVKLQLVPVPVPVPVFIPVPMNLYSQYSPVVIAVPVPVPVPLLVPPPPKKETNDAAVQSEATTGEGPEEEGACPTVSSSPPSGRPPPPCEEDAESAVPVETSVSRGPASCSSPPMELPAESLDDQSSDQKSSSRKRGVKRARESSTGRKRKKKTNNAAVQSEAAAAAVVDEEGACPAVSSSPPSGRPPPPCEEDAESAVPVETSVSRGPASCSSPPMELPAESLDDQSSDQKSSSRKRGVKRAREGSTGRKRGRRRKASTEGEGGAEMTSAAPELNHMYGVKAWRSWVHQRSRRTPHLGVHEDVLQCNSAELSVALSRFIKEVSHPSGGRYGADSIFYLCLGIQQYLFLKGRIENIFTDDLYSQFASDITGMLHQWKPAPTGGVSVSRVEESFLWECKQLGAYSPIVLLNTLLFFFTKHFQLLSLDQHHQLSFSSLHWSSRTSSRGAKVHFLHYQPDTKATPPSGDTENFRKKASKLEIVENVSNPLHCPVRLYEFYLSRCPVSAKQRRDLFYLQPERNVHTHSPHWFTPQPLDSSTLQSMLTRILAVKEVQQEQEAAGAPPTAGEEEEHL